MHAALGQDTKKRQPIHSAAVSACRLFLLAHNTADIFLRLMPRCHHFMTTAKALEPEVCTGTQDFPAFFSAGVRFFHHQNIV